MPRPVSTSSAHESGSSRCPEQSTQPAAAPPIQGLKDLTREIQRAPGFPEVLAALKNGRSATIDGAWGSAVRSGGGRAGAARAARRW